MLEFADSTVLLISEAVSKPLLMATAPPVIETSSMRTAPCVPELYEPPVPASSP